MTTKIKLRRAAAASWTSVNPILDLGEMGIETDTYKLKVGNGTDTWSNLAYFVHAWSDISGKPTVIASGSTKSAARSAIDAASLDSNGKVPASELPNSIMEYQGTWNASTNSPSLVDGTGSAGDVYRVSVAGSRNFGSGSISFDVGDYVIYSGSVWEKSDTTDAVSSVAGRTGAVTLTVADIGGDTTTALGVGSLNVGHATDTTLTRSAAGVLAVEGVNLASTASPTFTGTATFATVAPEANNASSVGYTGMPANSQTAAYTLVAGDAGKHIIHPASDNNARTFTIPANSSVAFPVGTVITFVNLVNTVTIAITSDTLTQAGTGSTGSRTLAANGLATCIKVGSTQWMISGSGLS